MKKILFTLFLVLATFAAVQAQPGKQGNDQKRPSMEEFFQMKLDFVIKDLKLSAADSIKFAPLYREYQAAKGELMRNASGGRSIGFKMMKKETVTEQDYLSAARGELEYKVKDAELTKSWYAKFEAVLTPQQLFTLIRAEERFAAEMMNRHGRRGGQGNGAGRPGNSPKK